MKRRHLFEFTDLEGCPPSVRCLVTDYIRFLAETMEVYAPVVPLLARALRASGATQVVDLCSGSGGPAVHLRERLRVEEDLEVSLVLSDRFPDPAAMRRFAEVERVTYVPESVDARSLPAELSGFRTLFEGLHHLRPEEARAVIHGAVRDGVPIAVFEMSERSVRQCALTALTPLALLAQTPFVRPRTLSRWALTYAVPVASVVVTWDAMVSNLRTYTVAELREMADSASGPAFTWEMGCVRSTAGIPITYAMGWPTVR